MKPNGYQKGICGKCKEPVYSDYGHFVRDDKGIFYKCETERYETLLAFNKVKREIKEYQEYLRLKKKYEG